MKPRALAVVSLCLLFGALPAKGDKKDVEQIQGTWDVVDFEKEGKKAPPKAADKLAVTFTEGQYSLSSDEGFTGSSKGAYKLDPDKKPGEIDIVPADGPSQGKTIRGIYELDGDNLKACFDSNGKERPTVFATKSHPGWVLVIYKRAKP